jgi:hypothetical protein
MVSNALENKTGFGRKRKLSTKLKSAANFNDQNFYLIIFSFNLPAELRVSMA